MLSMYTCINALCATAGVYVYMVYVCHWSCAHELFMQLRWPSTVSLFLPNKVHCCCFGATSPEHRLERAYAYPPPPPKKEKNKEGKKKKKSEFLTVSTRERGEKQQHKNKHGIQAGHATMSQRPMRNTLPRTSCYVLMTQNGLPLIATVVKSYGTTKSLHILRGPYLLHLLTLLMQNKFNRLLYYFFSLSFTSFSTSQSIIHDLKKNTQYQLSQVIPTVSTLGSTKENAPFCGHF